MKKLSKIVLALLTLLAAACSESDGDKVVVIVRCSDYQPRTGQIVRFDIDAFTTDGSSVTELQIASFDPEYGSCGLVDVTAGKSRFQYSYEYAVPTFRNKNVDLEMIFRAISDVGDTQTVSVMLEVESSVMPSEYVGVTLYSPASGRADGFSLAAKETVFTADGDGVEADICIPQGENGDVLERMFVSHTGLRFVKAESFDYASATAQTLAETFDNSVKSNVATELAVGDTIVFGREDGMLGVIRIVGITDYDGAMNDCIIFNIKVV